MRDYTGTLKIMLLMVLLTGCNNLVCIDHKVFVRHDGILTQHMMYDGIRCEQDQTINNNKSEIIWW